MNTIYTIYISGPITEPKTGLPREGWKEDFLEAEAKLRKMGFRVLNPVDIAREVEECYQYKCEWETAVCVPGDATEAPTRADYVMACLQRMKMNHDQGHLQGVYVLGSDEEVRASAGVQMELWMSEILDIPIYADQRDGHRSGQTPDKWPETIQELAKKKKNKRKPFE